MSQSLILAVDPGRRTGFAFSSRRCDVYAAAAGDDGEAMARWMLWLGTLIADLHVKHLVVERAFMSSRIRDGDFTVALIRAAHAVAWRHDVPRSEYAAVTVRKSILGRGRGTTDVDRISAARELGWVLTADHAADAALLLEHHMRVTAVVRGDGT